jgi:hypothetical protein
MTIRHKDLACCAGMLRRRVRFACRKRQCFGARGGLYSVRLRSCFWASSPARTTGAFRDLGRSPSRTTLRQDRHKRIWPAVPGCSFRGFGLRCLKRQCLGAHRGLYSVRIKTFFWSPRLVRTSGRFVDLGRSASRVTLRQVRHKRIWSAAPGRPLDGFGLLAEHGSVWGRTAAYIHYV